MAFVSNETMYKAARAGSETFKQITPESYEEFKGKIAAMTMSEAQDLYNKYTTSLMMIKLNKVEGKRAKNPYDKGGLIERFSMPFAGIKENAYILPRRPINPKFIDKVDGVSVDQQLYVKPEIKSLYYTFNDNYQNPFSIPTDDIKTAVLSADSMDLFISGYTQGQSAEFTIWEREHIANIINEMLNSKDFPLQDSQVIEVAMSNDVTRDELVDLILQVKNTVSAIDMIESTAFNANKFPKYAEASQLTLYVRPGFKHLIDTIVLSSAFHADKLNLNINVEEVPDFGGLVPSKDGTLANQVYIVYDELGRPTDAYTEDAAGETPYTGNIVYYDPNADVIGMIAEHGLLFIDDQNPYEVSAAPYNAAGRYVTYWPSKPNVGFHFDPQKILVVLKKKKMNQ